MSKIYKTVPCDKKGRPIVPSDIGWRQALGRAVTFLSAGLALVPVGVLTYNFVPLPENMAMVRFVFGMLMFFGALFVLYGVTVTVIALLQKRKTPAPDVLMRRAIDDGALCSATVKEVRVKTVKTGNGVARRYRLMLEYEDERYKFTRKFDSGWESEKAYAAGDRVNVYYHPDSNIDYFVDVSGEKRAYH